MTGRLAAIVVCIVGLAVLTNGQAASQGRGQAAPRPIPQPKLPPVEGFGTVRTVPMWTGETMLGDSHIQDLVTVVTIAAPLAVSGGTSTGISGSGAIGVSGTGGSGPGVVGQSSGYIGVLGTGSVAGVSGQGTSSGAGVFGLGGLGVGVEGSSTGNHGVFGHTGNAFAAGVVGINDEVANGGVGIYGLAHGPQGIGISGVSNDSSTGSASTGVRGQANDGIGVLGLSTSSTGVVGTGLVGVQGWTEGQAAGTVGVHAISRAATGTALYAENLGTGKAGDFHGWVQIVGDLQVTGNASKPGGGPWSSLSDRRAKQSIAPIQNSLATLLRLRGVTYQYTNPSVFHELPGTHMGMVAQEVEQVFPSWVDTGADGYKRVTFRGLEALTVEAVRELNALVNVNSREATTRLDDLERQNAELRHAIEVLSATVKALQQNQR